MLSCTLLRQQTQTRVSLGAWIGLSEGLAWRLSLQRDLIRPRWHDTVEIGTRRGLGENRCGQLLVRTGISTSCFPARISGNGKEMKKILLVFSMNSKVDQFSLEIFNSCT